MRVWAYYDDGVDYKRKLLHAMLNKYSVALWLTITDRNHCLYKIFLFMRFR